MAFYEHVVIARQDISPQQGETLNEELKALIESLGGHIAKIEHWGLRNLTYRIKKNRKGHYSLLRIDAPAATVIAANAAIVTGAMRPVATSKTLWRRDPGKIMTDETVTDSAPAAGGQ